MQAVGFQGYHKAGESEMGLGQVKNATELIAFTEIEQFFPLLLLLLLLFKHSLDCCKPLGNFQSSETFDSDH